MTLTLLQENEQFLDITLHSPHLFTVWVQAFKSPGNMGLVAPYFNWGGGVRVLTSVYRYPSLYAISLHTIL
jgi:hypothetical protein